MKKALLFIRTSTERQETQSQLKETKEYAIDLGYKDFVVLERAGASAYKVSTKYVELVEDMKAMIEADPDIDAVVCWHLNRLSRNPSKALEIEEYLVKHHIQLYVKTPQLKLLNDDGTENEAAGLIFMVYSKVSQYQIDELRDKSHRAKDRDKALKKYLGGKVKFGYKVVDKQNVEDPVQSKIVNDIFDLYGSGQYSFVTLAKEIQERYGVELPKYRIAQILWCTAYYDGEMYPPIITKAQFDKAQKQRTDSQAPKPPMTSKHSYFGNRIVQCAKCGYGMTADVDGYRCINRCKGNKYVGVGNMDGLLWLIASHLEGERLLNASARDEYIEKQAVLRAKISGVAQSIAKVEKRAEKAKKMCLNDLLTVEEYKAVVDEVEQQTKDIKAKQTAWQAEIVELQHLIEEDKLSIQRILTIADKISESDEKEMRNIVRRWIKKVTVDDDFNVEVHTLVRVYKVHYRKHSPAPWYTISGKRLAVAAVVRKDGNCCLGDNAKRFNKPLDIPATLAWLGGADII